MNDTNANWDTTTRQGSGPMKCNKCRKDIGRGDVMGSNQGEVRCSKCIPATVSKAQKTAESQVAKDAAKKAKSRLGAGWDMMSPEIQEAMVAREIVSILLGQVNVGEEMAVMQRIARASYEAAK